VQAVARLEPDGILKRLGQLLDDVLLITLLAATVAHIAGFMQAYEESWLWWAAWLQAVGIDLATLRASYLYKVSRPKQARVVALVAVAFFSACSAILNMAYYIRAGAHVVVALPMAVFFPVAIVMLSYLRGVRDVLDERRDRRQAGRMAGQAGTGVRPDVQAVDEIGQIAPVPRSELRLDVGRLRSQGLTLREISRRTGIPRSTVGAWLRRDAHDSVSKEPTHGQ
jgi:hypothetical protein